MKSWEESVRVSRLQRDRYRQQYAEGTTWRYSPRTGEGYSGQTVTVLRAPRLDTTTASARIQFADGHELRVPLNHLQRLSAEPYHAQPLQTSDVLLEEARRRPAWSRLVRAIITQLDQVAAAASTDHQDARDQAEHDAALTGVDIDQRVRTLVGSVALRDMQLPERGALMARILEAATADAEGIRGRRPGRAGHPQRPEAAPVVSLHPVTLADLDQAARTDLNRIAQAIHRRWFLSDRELQERLTARQKTVRRAIRKAAQDVGGDTVLSAPQPRPAPLMQERQEALAGMYRDAIEACRLWALGQDAEATLMRDRALQGQAQFRAVSQAIEAARPQTHTGRAFHGDYLSVREYRANPDEWRQWYVRVTFVYAPDGHTWTVANARELEAASCVEVGESGWRDLCRWVEDQSHRKDGRLQGRRQDDDEHLIYRSDDDHLRLRTSISQQYPGLPRALEAIRRSMLEERDDLMPRPEELPHNRPPAGEVRSGGA